MADLTEWPSETMTEPELNGLRPLSNADDFSLTSTGNSLSRVSHHAGITIRHILENEAGYEEEDNVDDDEEDDDVDEIYYDDNVASGDEVLREAVELYPFVQNLTVSNLDECVQVEEAFPEQERCTREKFLYRLSRCSELSLGLFSMPPIENGQPKPEPTLVGHIVATRTSSPRVTDASMKLPPNWENERISFENGQPIGHEETGSTICIHSLAVRPQYQRKSAGRILMKAYLQRMDEAKVAERIALIAHDHLVKFYESLGFENMGPSVCQFGGGGWIDMIYNLK